MNGETKKFKMIVSIVLAVALLWSAFVSVAFFLHLKSEKDQKQNEFYNLYVCGTPVYSGNADDVLGDGTVMYDKGSNILMLIDATLEYNGTAAIFAERDLTIYLSGENKIICKGSDTSAAIYASDLMLRKDLSFMGNGSLTIEGDGEKAGPICGIVADDIWCYSNISVVLTDVAEGTNGIECSHLALIGENKLSVKVDSTGESAGVFVWGEICLLENTALEVTNINAGKSCKGIECAGSFIASKGSAVTSSEGEEGVGILCHGVFFDYGANVNTTVDAVDGIRNEDNN